jgi:hypothetical protein
MSIGRSRKDEVVVAAQFTTIEAEPWFVDWITWSVSLSVCVSGIRHRERTSRTGSQLTLYDMDCVARNDSFVEQEPGLRAIPEDKFIQRVSIATLRL